jgi:cytochrome d ubiquinol oxidase subunit II
VTALVAAFGLWTQVAHGNDLTWMVLAVAVIAQLSTVMVLWSRGSDGWAFVGVMTVVAAVVVLLFGSLYPNLVPSTLNPDWSLTIHNASSTAYTLKIMSWAALIFAPLVMLYQGWTYWVFRKRITADRIPEPIGLSRQSP